MGWHVGTCTQRWRWGTKGHVGGRVCALAGWTHVISNQELRSPAGLSSVGNCDWVPFPWLSAGYWSSKALWPVRKHLCQHYQPSVSFTRHWAHGASKG